MGNTRHSTSVELEAGLDFIRQSPKDTGRLELIVRRPQVGEREILNEAVLSTKTGLVGDTWISRGSSRTSDGSPHPDMQLTLMNSRVISLLAQSKDQWALAGDQLFVDFDLSATNIPAGTQLAIGTAVVEITAQPHTGCQKFATRFGRDALAFVNAPNRRESRLRGANARVVQSGEIQTGDVVKKCKAVGT
jgi:MOSC domain